MHWASLLVGILLGWLVLPAVMRMFMPSKAAA
jgi:Tfp pilus assembly protein PilW